MISLRQDIFQEDALQIANWLEDEEILAFLNEEENINRRIRHLVSISNMPLYTPVFNTKGSFYLICLHEKPIGFVKFTPNEAHHEIVIAIGEKQLWGKGYGKDALKKALCEAFLSRRYTRVHAKIKAQNSRSLSLFQHLGFGLEEWHETTLHLFIDFKTFLKMAA